MSSNVFLVFFFLLDIDECETDTDNCDVNAHCNNTKGSFQCTCNIGYSGDGVVCEGAFLAWKRKTLAYHLFKPATKEFLKHILNHKYIWFKSEWFVRFQWLTIFVLALLCISLLVHKRGWFVPLILITTSTIDSSWSKITGYILLHWLFLPNGALVSRHSLSQCVKERMEY